MHELGIVFHIIKTLEEVGEENRLTSISSVTLQLGEVSGVVDSYLTDCWRWAADKTGLLRGARLIIEPIPAVTHCEGCGGQYPTVAHGRLCPRCGSERTYLLTGSEITIKEVEGV